MKLLYYIIVFVCHRSLEEDQRKIPLPLLNDSSSDLVFLPLLLTGFKPLESDTLHCLFNRNTLHTGSQGREEELQLH